MLKKLLLSLAFYLIYAVGAYAQATLSGTVTDITNGEPIPGVNVFIEELSKGAATDPDGNYRITGIEPGTYTIVAKFIGYEEYRSTFEMGGSNQTLDIELKSSLVDLDEVVVTGYRTIDRQAYSGAASQVSAQSIESVPVASVDQVLQGNAAGVTVTATSGTPGATQDIRIRGISSIEAGLEPLFVIDGVPVVNGNFSGFGSTSSLGALSNINPSDIESVTVLKDAVATAPYGARGSNGVIVITTKKGSYGDARFNVKYQRGINNRAVEGPGAMNAFQYDDYFTARYGVDMQAAGLWDGETNTDWGDLVTNEDAVQQDISVSASGGNRTTKYFVSGNFFTQEGQAVGSELNRLGGKFNFSHQLNENVTIRNNVQGSFVEQDGFLEGSSFFGSPVFGEFAMLSTDPARNPDGTYNINNLNALTFNPLYLQENDVNRTRSNRVLNNTNIDIRITDNLTFTSTLSLDYLNTEEKFYANRNHGGGINNNGEVSDFGIRNFNYVWQNNLTYFYTPNADHEFTFTAITESQRNYQQQIETFSAGFAADGLINANSAANPLGTGGQTTDWASQAFNALVNYGYQNKAFLDLSLRYEGNSRFAEDERWGTFYSAGASYILTEEQFVKDLNLDWLTNFKLRTSYGITGNASIALNQYQATVTFGDYSNRSNIILNSLGNRALTWERATSFDAGFSFELLEKITGSFTWFNKTSTDLLRQLPLTRTSGHNDILTNGGELFNRGIEVELSADIVRTKNFSWRLGGNFATLENEITELPTDGAGEPITDITATRYVAVEGFPVAAWHMREWAGVDPDNGDPLWYVDVVDANGNVTGRETTNNYAAATRYFQDANALPTRTAGINTRFDIKNFYVSANLYYAGGNKVYDSWGFVGLNDGQFTGSLGAYEGLSDYWTPDNRNAANPRPGAFTQNSTATSTRYLYDGDFIRLRTVNIGYNLPSSLTDRVGLSSASVFFVGQNLWTYVFDDRLEFDPEVRGDGFLDFNAAPLRSFTFGVNLNF